MKTKIDLINDCFSMLLRTGVTVNASPEDNTLALNRLEDMMAELESRNLATGYNFEDSPEPDSPSGLENWMNLAISQMLAMRVWPDFSPDEVNPMLARNSAQSSANLSARLAQQNVLKYARRTPLGSGNQPYQQYNKFFGNYGTTCGPSDVGSGSCAPAPTPPAPAPCSCDVIPLSHLKLLGDEALFGASEKQYSVTGFYSGATVGGGLFVFKPDGNKASHNGVTVYAPEALQAWAGTQADIATLLNWTGSGSGVWVRTNISGAINVKMAGAVGNDTAIDTASVQAAVDATVLAGGSYALYIPEGVYKLNAPINIITALRVYGDGCSPYVTNTGTRGGGSWLHFAHSGKGLNVDGTGMLSGVYFEKFGTFRDQPTPVSGWAPNNHDFDIYVDNADVTLDEITLLNPTKGFKLTNTQAGRLTIRRLRGQPLQVGIDIDVCYDLPQIENIHFWPYWKDDMNVHNYTMQNLDAIYLRRVDNPQLLNIFTIFARAGIRITQSAAGTVSKMMLANADFDRGTYGLWIDATVTGMTTSKIVNFSCYGEAAVAGSKAILIQGSNCKLQLENIGTENHHQNAIRVEGTGNVISVGNADFTNWNQSGVGFPAVEALNGNIIQFSQPATTTGGGGAAVYESSTGTIYSDDLWIPHSTTVTSQSGTITTVGAASVRYKRKGRLVDVVFDITITTNGTGSGDVRFTLPFSAAGFSNGAGREVSLTGTALSVQTTNASSNCQIIKFDNTYPAANGSRLVGSISYRI